MASNVKRDHHLWTRDTIKNVSGNVTLDIDGDITLDPDGDCIIDRNTALIADGTAKGLHIDYDHTAAAGMGQTVNGIGLDLDMNCETVTHAGAVRQTAIDIDMVAATDGIQSNVGIDIACSGSDHCSGLIIDVDGSGTVAGIQIDSKDGGKDFVNRSSANVGDYFMINTIAEGVTTLSTVDANAAVAHLNIEADGHVEFDGCGVGFDQVTASFDATNTTVDFTSGNKQHLTLTADVSNLFFKFPATSGNFLCVVLQDGTGGWNVTNFKGLDSAGNANANGSGTDGVIRWAGASAPALTETADKADILTFYWDATSANEIAYGIFSENF